MVTHASDPQLHGHEAQGSPAYFQDRFKGQVSHCINTMRLSLRNMARSHWQQTQAGSEPDAQQWKAAPCTADAALHAAYCASLVTPTSLLMRLSRPRNQRQRLRPGGQPGTDQRPQRPGPQRPALPGQQNVLLGLPDAQGARAGPSPDAWCAPLKPCFRP